MAVEAAFMVPHPPMIISEIGGGREKSIQRTIDSYIKISKEIAEIKPDTIIISSPHTVLYSDYFHLSSNEIIRGDFSRFGASNVFFTENVDLALVNKISSIGAANSFPTGLLDDEQELDHGSMIPLYFIRKYYTDFKVVIVGLSGLPFSKHYEMGQIIKKAVDDLDRKVVFVASGDLSHKLQSYGPYGFVDEGPIYDERIMNIMGEAKFLELLEFDSTIREKASECGHRSFIIMAGALDGKDLQTEVFSHEDITGVGYGICSYYPIGNNYKRCFLKQYLEDIQNNISLHQDDEYINLARKTIEEYLVTGEEISISNDLPSEMLENRAGVFVSIHEESNLRGCIGTIYPVTSCIAEEIIHNAISAAFHDPRFSPIKKEELPYLEISVDVLYPPEDICSLDELDVKKYGVIVSSGMKRGLLLPNLDGIDTVEEQVKIAKRKGNISDLEDVKLQRFEVVRHE